MMLEYPKWDTTDCRINATYNRIVARRQADAERVPDVAWQYGRVTPLKSPTGASSKTRRVGMMAGGRERSCATFLWQHGALWTTLTLVAVAMLTWRLVL